MSCKMLSRKINVIILTVLPLREMFSIWLYKMYALYDHSAKGVLRTSNMAYFE